MLKIKDYGYSVLEKTEHIDRNIRVQNFDELVSSDWSLLREAMICGREELALELMENIRSNLKDQHDACAEAMAMGCTFVADTFGEEAIPGFWHSYNSSYEDRWPTGLDALEEMEACMVRQRQHQGHGVMYEEDDRYVGVCDPCGSGGKLRREGIGGVTKKAYPWSWNRAGIPYYCCHCSVMWEIDAINISGYHERINVLSDDINGPCYNYFYKNPEDIPEKYYTCLGLEKPKPEELKK